MLTHFQHSSVSLFLSQSLSLQYLYSNVDSSHSTFSLRQNITSKGNVDFLFLGSRVSQIPFNCGLQLNSRIKSNPRLATLCHMSVKAGRLWCWFYTFITTHKAQGFPSRRHFRMQSLKGSQKSGNNMMY